MLYFVGTEGVSVPIILSETLVIGPEAGKSGDEQCVVPVT